MDAQLALSFSSMYSGQWNKDKNPSNVALNKKDQVIWNMCTKFQVDWTSNFVKVYLELTKYFNLKQDRWMDEWTNKWTHRQTRVHTLKCLVFFTNHWYYVDSPKYKDLLQLHKLDIIQESYKPNKKYMYTLQSFNTLNIVDLAIAYSF